MRTVGGRWVVLVALVAAGCLRAGPLDDWVARHPCAVVSDLPLDELSALAGDFGDPGAAWEPTETSPPPELAGAETAWLRRVLVVDRPSPGALFAERALAGLPDEERGWLQRGYVGFAEDPPELCAMLGDAVYILLKKLDDPASRRHLEHVAYWMAGDLYDEIARFESGLREPSAWLWIKPHRPTDDDPTDQSLVLWFPVPGPEHGGSPLHLVHAEEWFDTFEHTLQAEHGMIPLDEFIRRLTATALETEQPGSQTEAMRKPVTLPARTAELGAIVTALAAQTGATGTVDAELARAPVTAAIAEQPLWEVLPALARAAGGVLLEEAGGVRLAVPACPWERMWAQAPLRWWATAQMTKVERNWCRQIWRRELWSTLDEAAREELRAGRPLSQCEPAVLAAARRLADSDLGLRWKALLDSLPERNGRVPIWLYEYPEEREWELASPFVSEVVRGYEALRLLQRLHPGEPIIVHEERRR